ncbi:uncharacterized protein KY384_008355 [Bacidia gigantensis]|uniref:uncharacterized protein n=1 Tax=Bacidia gigantensis TaxID=2732470 RepID=UPI001D056DEF|nr:uncharacterized protein KY384_008355 [Bacidia gigantensis]KAG8526926.1 hypothetical protein KY384_008355 [Bacidia gigantensis]
MFTAIGLFKDVSCPEQSRCNLPNCIFAHDVLPKNTTSNKSARTDLVDDDSSNDYSNEPRKRRRLNDRTLSQSPENHDNVLSKTTPPSPGTTARPISPPPLRRAGSEQNKVSNWHVNQASQKLKPSTLIKIQVSLNPRILASPPATHTFRMQLIKLLHEQMHRLNEEVKQSDYLTQAGIALTGDMLILKALEEEESIAKGNSTVYANVVKLRIGKLKKMKLADWKEERLAEISKKPSSKAASQPKSSRKEIVTGLTSIQEVSLLSRLLAKQAGLEKYGYVNKKIPQTDLERARNGLDSAHGWEQCERCKTRFQVFPGRRQEDGALTSGGTCTYHPAKPRRPIAIDKADKISKDLAYACCKESIGTSVGCTKASSHVFKVSDPSRLDLVMPFTETPENPNVALKHPAICFDCEMGYTTMGLELIRLTATDWPSGSEVLDVLVRPIGEVLDLNSQFSGVWPKDFAEALPYDSKPSVDTVSGAKGDVQTVGLPIVDSPYVARELLFSHLSPSTPLMGHALDNDLNTTRIIHDSIVDTVLLYPHPKGLPVRFGLKMLMKRHLDCDIQMGDGAAGHDSKEDARAAGELIRWKVKETWEKMGREGWTIENDNFLPPLTRAEAMRKDIEEVKSRALTS